MWSNSLTKDQTQAPCVVSAAFTTGPPRKSLTISVHIVLEILASAVKQDKEEESIEVRRKKQNLIVCSISVLWLSKESPMNYYTE